jgi:formylglycine-generating enzyme required for sulfatase activity
VTLRLEGLPEGVQAEPKEVPAGADQVALHFTAPREARVLAGTYPVKVIAGAGSARAEERFTLTLQPSPPTAYAGLRLRPLADVILDPGQSKTLPVQVERDSGVGEVDIRLEHVPEGIWSEAVVLAAGDNRVDLPLGARLETGPGPATVREVKVVARSGNRHAEQRLRVTLRHTLPREIVNSVGMKLVLVQPGKFRMGSPPDEAGRNGDETEHDVQITYPFYVGTNEVTQEQYEKITGKNPSKFKEGAGGGPTHPVDSVTWLDARAYCKELTERERDKGWGAPYRLPREAEWEYACRAGAREYSPFCCGLTLPATLANYDGNHPYGGVGKGVYREKTTPAGKFDPNAWGLYDMHGNLMEWCEDWYDPEYYNTSPARDPRGPERAPAGSDRRVLRGGSWYSPAAICRSAQRESYLPTLSRPTIGFRVVLIPWVRTAP